MEIIPTDAIQPSLPTLPAKMLPAIKELVDALKIPREVLASDDDIESAWNALPRELKNLPKNQNLELIARMCVAISTGLFDSAMNYIWNASILCLREKVRTFGLQVVAQIKASDFEEKNLIEQQDSQLLDLCHELNILSNEGFFFLDQCREIRNNFSAAHPTIGKINDREFLVFLNRCIKFALADSSSLQGVVIKDFITAVKGPRFTDEQKQVWVDRIRKTHDAQRLILVTMVHGIYCDPSSPEPARLNSLDLCNDIKDEFSSNVKSSLISSHSDYFAKGDDNRYRASLQFFERLGMLGSLNHSEKHTVILKAVDQLWTIHRGTNNFYNEPPFAERLLELSRSEEIPETIQEKFVQVVIGCYIGDGYGVCWAAESFYINLIKEFSPREIFLMLKSSYSEEIIVNRVRNNRSCRERYLEAIKLIDVTNLQPEIKSEYEKVLHHFG